MILQHVYLKPGKESGGYFIGFYDSITVQF